MNRHSVTQSTVSTMLAELTVAQLAKKLPSIYVTQESFTLLTGARLCAPY